MKNKSILDKSISLWWNSLGEYEKQHILTRNKFVGVLVTDEWKAKCYHTEHPTNPLLEIPTDNKGEVNWKLEYDILYKERDEIREVSHKRKEQNAKLLSDIKVLKELESNFYMAICRAYNAGKQNMADCIQAVADNDNDNSTFKDSHSYFTSEFPEFKTNVP